MGRRARIGTMPVVVAACLAVWLTVTGPVSAATSALGERQATAPADHLTGDFVACAVVLEFTLPAGGSAGSLLLDGVATVEPHAFEILTSASINEPGDILALAAGDGFACLRLHADDDGRLISVYLPWEADDGPNRICGTINLDGDTYVVTDSASGVPIRLITLEPSQAPLLDAFIAGSYVGRVACVYFSAAGDGAIVRVGPVACGSVADANPDPDLAIVVLDGNVIGSVDTVEIDGFVVPAPESLRSIGLLEWAHAVQMEPEFAGSESVCVHDIVYGAVEICGSLVRDGDTGWLEAGGSRTYYARAFLTSGEAIDQTLAVSAGARTCLRLVAREFHGPLLGDHFSRVTIDACLVVGEDGRFTTIDGTAQADLGPYIREMDPTLRPGDTAGVHIRADEGPDASNFTLITRMDIEGCVASGPGPTPGPGTGRPTVTPPATDVVSASTRPTDPPSWSMVVVLAALSAFVILSVRRANRRRS